MKTSGCRHKLLPICILLAALWHAPLVRPIHAADRVVTDCSSDAQLRALLVEMQADAGGGTLSFDCGMATIILTGGVLPTIFVNTTIDGSGTITLSGNNTTRLFYVNEGATLTLQNITIRNGYWDLGDGGAIRNHGTLNIHNSRFLDNQTGPTWSGGAIVTYGPLTISDSEFAGNRGGGGGAIYPRFAGAVTTITNTSFHDNETTSPTSGWGGAMLLWDGAPVTIAGSTFYNNTASQGGAIYIFANSTLMVTNSTISGNSAAERGGGIANTGLTTLANSTVSDNDGAAGGGIDNRDTGSLIISKSALSGNAAVDGGGIRNLAGTATLIDSTVSSNDAYTGGGIFNTGTANLYNSTVSGNTASSTGGGIDNRGTMTLTSVTLLGNEAERQGGGLYHAGTFAGNTLTLLNSILAHSPVGANCHQSATSAAPITSDGFNLSSDASCASFFNQGGDQNYVDPLLGELADNGGPTLTHLPQEGSPAIDRGQCVAVNPILSSLTDQRGVPRPQGPACDIGSVEVQADDQLESLYLPVLIK